MKKLFIGSLVCIMAMVFCSASAFAVDDKFYVGLEGGYSLGNLKSGGFNTAGPHQNTGDDDDGAAVIGIHFGREFSFLRADLGFYYRTDFDFTTASYQPPTPTFFYTSDVKTYSFMASIYVEPWRQHIVSPYFGAGIGTSRIKLENLTDTVVTGVDVDSYKLTWQAEVGVEYSLAENFRAQLGFRYVDMGSVGTSLLVGIIPLGNYTADIRIEEIVLGARYRF